MGKVKHFLITRFNLYNSEWTITKYGKIINKEEWLKQRWLLFHQYCLPSVENQNYKNFQWLIFFDIRTPNNFKGVIKNELARYKFITCFFIDGFSEFESSLIEFIGRKCPNNSQVITTRLDNDDLIHRDFIKQIQSQAAKVSQTSSFLISCPKGLTLQVSPFVKITKYEDVYNPFITLVENKNDSNVKTIFQVGHDKYKDMKIDCFYTQSNHL